MPNAISYIKNVGKSIGYSSVKVLKDMNPVYNDFADTNGELMSDMYRSVKNLKSNAKRLPKSAMDSEFGQFGKTYLDNLMSDLKTGKFYNKERIDKYENDAMESMMGSNFDFSESDDDFNFDVSDDSTSTNDMIDIVGEKTSNAISNAMARSAEYVVQGTNQSNKAIYDRMNIIYGGLHAGMATINQNVSKMLEFSTSAMTTHFENSKTFYSEITKLDQERNQYLKEILDGVNKLSAPAPTSNNRYNSDFTYSDMVSYNGVLDFSKYFKNIKRNLNEKSGGMGDMISMAVENGMLKTLAASPLEGIIEGAIKMMIPMTMESAMENLNKSLSGLVGNAFLKLKDAAKGTSTWAAIAEILGIDTNLKKSLDPSKYEKGRVPFDGVTKKAITEVIPTYLAKILSAVSNDKESRYNYDTGKFVTVEEMRSEFNRLTKDSANRAAGDIDWEVKSKLRNYKLSKEKEAQFEKDWEAIKEYMYVNQKNFNTRDKKLRGSSFGLKGGLASDVNVRLLQEMLNNNPEMMRYAHNLFNERDRQNRQMQQYQNDGTLTALFNGSVKESKTKGGASIVAAANKSALSELSAIHKELSYIRIYGIGSSGNGKKSRGKKKASFDNFDIPEFKSGNDKEYDKNVIENTSNREDRFYSDDEIDKEVSNITKDAKKSSYESKKSSKSFSERMHEAAGLSAKMSVLASSATELAKKPAKFIVSVMDKADERLYDLIYGTKEDKKGNKSFAGKMFSGIENMFNKFSDFVDDTIFGPLKDKFTKENIHNATKRFFSWFGVDIDKTVSDVREYLFGVTEGKGKNKKRVENGLFGKFIDDFKDNMKSAGQWVKDAFRSFGDWTGTSSKKNKQGREKEKRNKDRDEQIKKYEDIIKSATANVSDAKEAATGIKRVNKTGLAVISEGEAIIPPDMNPFNIAKRRRNEKNVKRNLIKGINSAFEYAEGTPDATSGKSISDLISKNKISDDQRQHNNETKARIASDKIKRLKNSKEKYTKDDYEEGRNPFTDRVADEAVKGIKSIINQIKEALGLNNTDENNKKFQNSVTDYIGKIKEYGGTMAAGATIGAGTSLVTGLIGGPLVGAAIGAGVGLIKRSETVQKMLFGDIDKDGKRTGGLISKDLSNNIQKYLPDMSKGATVGGILAALPIVPGGPVAGIIVGSALGFAKNNENVQNAIFGEGKLLGKKEDFQKKVQSVLPKMGAGALAGLIAGPFGLSTNLILGSALGFAADTDKFKDAMFGEKDEDGKRTGGIMKAITEPAVDFFKKMYGEFKTFLFKDILQPVANALDPFKKQLQIISQNLLGVFKDTFKVTIGAPIERIIREKFIEPVGKKLNKIINGLLTPVKAIISAPFRAIGMAGNFLRAHQIKSGQADYMGAEQRNAFRKSKGFKMYAGVLKGQDKYKDLDTSLENMNYGDLDVIENTLSAIRGSSRSIGKIQRDSAKTISKELYSEKNDVKTEIARTAMDMIKTGSYEQAQKFVKEADINQAAKTKILATMAKETAKIKISKKMKEDRSSTVTEVAEKFKGLGLDLSPDMIEKLAKGDKEVEKLYNTIAGEKKYRDKYKKQDSPVEKLNDEQQKRHEQIIDYLKEISETLRDDLNKKGNKQGSPTESKKYSDQVQDLEDRYNFLIGESQNPEDEHPELADENEANYYSFGRKAARLAKKGVKGLLKAPFKLPYKAVGLGGKIIGATYKGGKKVAHAIRYTKPVKRVLGDNNTDWQNTIGKTPEAATGMYSARDGLAVVSEGEYILSPHDIKNAREYAVGGVNTSNNDKNTNLFQLFSSINRNIKNIAGNVFGLGLKNDIDTSKIDDNSGLKNYLGKVKNKFKKGSTTITQYVNGLPLKIRKDKNGDEYVDPSSSENRATQKKLNEQESTQKGILDGITSIPNKLGGLFTRFFGDKKDKNESWFSKLFKKVSTVGKVIAGVAVGVTAFNWAKKKIFPGLKLFWDEKMVPYFVDAWNGKKDGIGKFIYVFNPKNPEGLLATLSSFVTNKLPKIMETGATLIGKASNWALKNVLPNVVSTLIANLPTIAWGIIKGVVKGLGKLVKSILHDVDENDGTMSNDEGASFTVSNANAFENMGSNEVSWFDKNVDSSNDKMPQGNIIDTGINTGSDSLSGNISIKAGSASSNATDKASRYTNNVGHGGTGGSLGGETKTSSKKPGSILDAIGGSSVPSNKNSLKITDKALSRIKENNLPKAFEYINDVYYDEAVKEYNKVKDNIVTTEYGDMTIAELLDSDIVIGTASDGSDIHGYDMLRYNNYAQQLGMNIQLSEEQMEENTGFQNETTPLKLALKVGTKTLLRSKAGVTVGIKGAAKVIRTAGKVGGSAVGSVVGFGTKLATKSKTAGKLAKKATKGAITGATDTISQKMLNKAGQATEAADKVSTKSELLKKLGTKVKDSKLGNFITDVKEAVKGFFENSTVAKKFEKAFSSLGEKVQSKTGGVKSFINKICQSIIDKIVELLTKYGGNLGSKAAAKLSSYAASGAVLLIADAVWSFGSGFRNANTILGITEQPSIPIRLVCGVVEAINSIFLLGIVPLNIVVDAILAIFKAAGWDVFSDLEKKREEAKAEVEKYNKEHGTKFESIEAYNKKDRISTKIANAASGAASKVKDFAGGILSGVKGFFGFGGDDEDIQDNGISGSFATGTRRVSKTGLAIVSEGEAIIPPDMNPFNVAKRQRNEAAVMRRLGNTMPNLSNVPRYAEGTKSVQLNTASIMSNSANTVPIMKSKNYVSNGNGAVEELAGTNNKDELKTYITNSYEAVASGLKNIKSNIKDMVSNILDGATKEKTTVKDLFDKQYTVKTHSKYLNSSFEDVSKIIKAISAPTAMMQFAVKIIDEKVTKFFDIMEKVGKLSSTDEKIIEDGKDGKVSPFSKKYWSTTTDIKGLGGGLNKFYTLIQKVFNFPSVLMAFLNPVNIVKNAVEKIGNAFSGASSNSSSTQTSSSSSSTTAGSIISTFTNTVSNAVDWVKVKTGMKKSDSDDNSSDKKEDDNSSNEKKDNKSSDKKKKKSNKSGSGSWLFGRGSGTTSDGTFISQMDNKYKDISFNRSGDTEKQTIGDSGCAPAAAAMVVNSYARGNTLSMSSASKDALNYKVKNDGVSADYFGNEFSKHGLESKYITSNRTRNITKELLQNNKVVLMGQDSSNGSKSNSPFGPNPHYIVANGLSKDGNSIYVNDPESSTPNTKYNANKVLKHSKLGIAVSPGSGSKIRNIKRTIRKYTGRATKLSHDDAAKLSWAVLKNNGFSDAATAGVLGNFEAESGMDSSAIQYPNGPAAGINQWETVNDYSSRWGDMAKFAEAKGKDWTDLQSQLEFIIEKDAPPAFRDFTGHGVWTYPNGATAWWPEAMTIDDYKKLTDIDKATEIWEKVFGRGSVLRMDERIKYAREYYNKFSGKTVDVNGLIDSNSTSTTSGTEDSSSSSSSSGTIIDKIYNQIFPDLAKAYGIDITTSSSSSSNGTSAEGGGGVSSDADTATKQRAVVAKAKSIEGTIQYSMSGPRDPDQGSADCSSFVQWAYNKTLGVDIGGYTGAQTQSDTTYVVDEAGGTSSDTPDQSKLQLGDLLFYTRDYSQGDESTYPMGVGHVGMYIGDNKEVHHPSGTGPKELDLSSATRFRMAKRLVDFKSATISDEIKKDLQNKVKEDRKNSNSSSSSSSKSKTKKPSNGAAKSSGLLVGMGSRLQDPKKFKDEANIVRKLSSKNKSLAKKQNAKLYGKGSNLPYETGLKYVQGDGYDTTSNFMNIKPDTTQNKLSHIKYNNTYRVGKGSNIHQENITIKQAASGTTKKDNSKEMLFVMKAMLKLIATLVTNSNQLNNIYKLLAEYFAAIDSQDTSETAKNTAIIAKQNLITAMKDGNTNQPNKDILKLIETAERIAMQ